MWLKTLKSSWVLISPHVCPLKHPWILSRSVAWPLQGGRAKSSMNIFGYNFSKYDQPTWLLKELIKHHQTEFFCWNMWMSIFIHIFSQNSCVMLDWLHRAWLVVRALKKPEPPLGVLSTTDAFNNARSSALLRWFEICVFWSSLLKTRKGNDMKPLKDIERYNKTEVNQLLNDVDANLWHVWAKGVTPSHIFHQCLKHVVVSCLWFNHRCC